MTPPPHDLEAEQIVLSAVLWGDRTAHQLRLRPRWFFGPEHGELWAVLLSIEELRERVEQLGMLHHGLPVLVARVLAVPPETSKPGAAVYVLPPRITLRRLREIMSRCAIRDRYIEDAARRIRDRARERWLLRTMTQIEAEIRAGECPDGQLMLAGVEGLLRVRQAHRRAELTEALDGRTTG